MNSWSRHSLPLLRFWLLAADHQLDDPAHHCGTFLESQMSLVARYSPSLQLVTEERRSFALGSRMLYFAIIYNESALWLFEASQYCAVAVSSISLSFHLHYSDIAGLIVQSYTQLTFCTTKSTAPLSGYLTLVTSSAFLAGQGRSTLTSTDLSVAGSKRMKTWK